MKQFALSSKTIYKILTDKKIESFHHVNTLKTSLTFIQNNALLSRQFVEQNSLIQTAQDSDLIDKKYSIWDDIFVDGLDLHDHFNRNSPYGCIMFKIDLKLLTLPGFQEVYITKDNPTNWHKIPEWTDRYYANVEEFNSEYGNKGKIWDGRIMFTFKNTNDKIKLNKFCKEIIVDNPHIFSSDKTKSLGHLTFNKIVNELGKNNLSHIKTTLRHSEKSLPFCWCVTNYAQMRYFNRTKLEQFFL